MTQKREHKFIQISMLLRVMLSSQKKELTTFNDIKNVTIKKVNKFENF